MIEYIHGDLTELTPAMAVVETAGVGYGLNISLNTYTAIQGKQEVKLYVHEVWWQVEEMTLSPFRFRLQAGARTLSPAHHRIGCGRQYGENDSLVDVAKRTVQRDFIGQ